MGHQDDDSVLMLSLEALRPGSASSTHFEAVATGLEQAGKTVHRSITKQRRLPRSLAMVWSEASFVVAGLRRRKIYARWHVLDFSVVFLSILRRKVVLEVNGTAEDIFIAHPRIRRVAPLVNLFASLQFRMADGVVAVSSGIAEWVTEKGGAARVVVAPNGGDLRLAEDRQPPASPGYAVFIGELAPWQGVETILAARERPSWPEGLGLVVVGDGTGGEMVTEYQRRGLLSYEGRLDHAEAMSILARASVSLSPQLMSISRNWVMGRPLKISESLILGVPCVATGFPDTERLLSDFPGCHLIYADDPDALAVAVSKAAMTGEERRAAIASKAPERCSWRQAIDAAHSLLFPGECS